MFIATDKIDNAVVNYYNYYFKRLKVGLTMGIESGSFLKTGMGKSYTANKHGEKIDKDFNVGKIILEPKEFVDAMVEMERLRKSAQVISIDEAGILVNLRKWQSFVNKAIADVVMTFRNLNSLCIFVTPDILLLDKQVRIFVSHLTRTKKELGTSDKVIVTAKPYTLYWMKQGNFYHTYHINLYARDLQRKIQLNSFTVGMPSKQLCRDYEAKVDPYKSKIRKSIIKIKKDVKNVPFFVDKFFNSIEQDPRTKDFRRVNPLIYFTKGESKPYVLADEVRDLFDVPVRKANVISRKINQRLEDQWIRKNSMKR